jgi:hypothetical protein
LWPEDCRTLMTLSKGAMVLGPIVPGTESQRPVIEGLWLQGYRPLTTLSNGADGTGERDSAPGNQGGWTVDTVKRFY